MPLLNTQSISAEGSDIIVMNSLVTVELNQRLYTVANLRKLNKNTKVENRIASLGFIGALLVGGYDLYETSKIKLS